MKRLNVLLVVIAGAILLIAGFVARSVTYNEAKDQALGCALNGGDPRTTRYFGVFYSTECTTPAELEARRVSDEARVVKAAVDARRRDCGDRGLEWTENAPYFDGGACSDELEQAQQAEAQVGYAAKSAGSCRDGGWEWVSSGEFTAWCQNPGTPEPSGPFGSSVELRAQGFVMCQPLEATDGHNDRFMAYPSCPAFTKGTMWGA